MTGLCSLVIITRNRPAFLNRSLEYYSSQRLGHPIYISDASDQDCLKEVGDIIEHHSGSLNINSYSAAPDETPFSRLGFLASKVETPYLAWVADDDFMIPSSIVEGIEYLENNKDYSTVLGRAMTFVVENNHVIGKIINTGIYAQKPCIEAEASTRIMQHMSNYTTTCYSIRRASLFRESMSLVNSAGFNKENNNYFAELLDSFITAAGGKIHKLPSILLLRQMHDEMTSIKEKGENNSLGRLIDSRWREDLKRFADLTSGYLRNELGLDQKTVNDVTMVSIASSEINYLRKAVNSVLVENGILKHVTRGRRRLNDFLRKIGLSNNFQYKSREKLRDITRSHHDRDILRGVKLVVEKT